jgi:hypothetical protein
MKLSDYSLTEAKKIIAENPQVIIPVSAPEIVQNLPLNISEFITQKIAEKVSLNTGIYETSPVLQGIITQFKPFPVIGTHHRRFSGLISDSVRSLCSAGVKKVFFITSSSIFTNAVKDGISNYRQMLPKDFSYEIIFWQNRKIVSDEVSQYFENLTEYFRSEAAIFLLANELKNMEIPKTLPELPFSKDEFEKWRKRGTDPEKLKKLTPNFRFSSWTDFTPPPKEYSFFEKLTDDLSKL